MFSTQICEIIIHRAYVFFEDQLFARRVIILTNMNKKKRIRKYGRGISNETSGVNGVFPPDDLRFGSDSDTICVFIYN